MAAIPGFITHYHRPDQAPFLNLSDLDDPREVFLIEKLEEVTQRFSLPGSARPDSYEGHQHQDFEHYTEVQVWTDRILS